MTERRKGPRPTSERLRRLLIMLPWLMERGEVPLAEVMEHFQVGERELVNDLELVAMCGLPPFVDEMIDVFIDDGVVYTGVPRLFTAQPQLTAPEAFAVLSSGRAALQLPGAEPGGALARALDKVEAALHAAGTAVAPPDALVIESPRPEALEPVMAAATSHDELKIVYRSAHDDEPSERTIVPQLVFSDRGSWYVVADDGRSGEERVFRIDRIEAYAATGRRGEPRSVQPPSDRGWFSGDDLPVVTLHLHAEAAWMVDRVPLRTVRDLADGVLEVTLFVTSTRWLESLLLRTGSAATVVSPAEWRDLGARAARRLLARYQ
jgi:proteasome accessory factor C